MHSPINDVDEAPDFIEKIAKRAGHILLGSIGLMFLVWTLYFLNFGALPTGAAAPAENTQVWGQFGDFVGGTLNSIFAFFSFMILIASLRLQVKELRLTREELALRGPNWPPAAGRRISRSIICKEKRRRRTFSIPLITF